MIQQLDTLAAVYAALEANASRLVVLYFYQQQCPNCIRAAPTIEARAASGALIFRVDNYRNREAADRFEIPGGPSFVFVRNGLVVARQVGFSGTQFDAALKL